MLYRDGGERAASLPLLPSSELIGSAFEGFSGGGWRAVRERDGGVAGWGGGERAKVTGADPPSLTARTPSPRPPRLKKKKRKQCEGWAGRGFAWTRWKLIGRLKLKRGSFRREE